MNHLDTVLPNPAILVLAAGSARRMRGADKLLQDVAGQSLLRRQVMAALATDAPVLVALRPDDTQRVQALSGLDVHKITVPDAETGMGASIRAGAKALADLPGNGHRKGGLAILPADMPELTAEDLLRVIDAFHQSGGARIVRGAGADGTPGHPVIFPARCFAALQTLSGDAGARGLLRSEEVVLCPLPARHALTDLDTPEAWADWRRRTGY